MFTFRLITFLITDFKALKCIISHILLMIVKNISKMFIQNFFLFKIKVRNLISVHHTKALLRIVLPNKLYMILTLKDSNTLITNILSEEWRIPGMWCMFRFVYMSTYFIQYIFYFKNTLCGLFTYSQYMHMYTYDYIIINLFKQWRVKNCACKYSISSL